MTTVTQVCNDALYDRIESIKFALENARQMLAKQDYLQCAVRLKEIAPNVEFDTLFLNVLDAVTNEHKAKTNIG